MDRFIESLSRVFTIYNLPPFLNFIPWFARMMIKLIGLLNFFEIPVEAGVTCEGMQAPMYLSINFTIIGLVILLFDSSMYVFCKVAPVDYNHQVSFFLHRMPLLSPERARWLEENLIKGFVMGAERMFKNLIQIIISKMIFKRFMPIYGTRWDSGRNPFVSLGRFTQICEDNYPGSETIAVYGATFFFYFLLPFMFHMLLNTFIFGLAPPSIEEGFNEGKSNNKGSEDARNDDFFVQMLRARRTSAMVIDAYSSHHMEGDDLDSSFVMYGKTFDCKCLSPANWFCRKQVIEEQLEEIDAQDVELFEHDPKFWQQPNVWTNYFLINSSGNYQIAALKYLRTMRWKFWMLVKLTFGWWDEEVTANMQIKKRSQNLDINLTDDDERHQDMLSAVGEGHSLGRLLFDLMYSCLFPGINVTIIIFVSV